MQNYFEIEALMYKLWPAKILTDTSTMHQSEVVTTMSRSPQVGLTRNVHKFNWILTEMQYVCPTSCLTIYKTKLFRLFL